jgi:hypothetical protein
VFSLHKPSSIKISGHISGKANNVNNNISIHVLEPKSSRCVCCWGFRRSCRLSVRIIRAYNCRVFPLLYLSLLLNRPNWKEGRRQKRRHEKKRRTGRMLYSGKLRLMMCSSIVWLYYGWLLCRWDASFKHKSYFSCSTSSVFLKETYIFIIRVMKYAPSN